MKTSGRTATAFAILLLIPLLALIATAGIQWQLNAALRKNLLKAYPQKSAVIENITVSSFCQLPTVQSDHDLSGLCTQNRNLSWVKSGAIFAICVGILMLAIIKCAGVVARKRRFLLLLLFAPGLHLTMLAMSILAVLYAALGIGALYYGGSALFGEIPVGIMLAFGVGAIYAVVSLIRAQLTAVQKAKLTIIGKSLERSRHAKLWAFVEQLADRMDAKRPQNIVAGLDPNFYVTEAEVICIDGKLRGRTMYLSLPLCRILSSDELASVLGHELGHYKGFDTRFSKWFFPIYRGASQAVASFGPSGAKKGSAGDLVTLPVFVILSFFLDSFSVAENEISRDRELSADHEAANAVSAKCIATSLVKIHAYAPVWPEVRNHMKQMIQQGKMVTNASHMFAEVVSQIPDASGEISQEGPIHPTDTHPPLSERLRSLDFDIADIKTQVSIVLNHASAIDLIGNADELEIELSEIVQTIMVKSGEARPEIVAEVVTATT